MKTHVHFFPKKILPLLILFITVPLLSFAQWSAPVNLSPSAVNAGLNESMGSCIGVSGDTVHVVWTDKVTATKAVLYYSRSIDTGSTWSNPIPITSPNGNAWNPAIAVNGSNVHVVWREIAPNGHRASWYKHSTDGGNTWGPNIFLDSTADWPAVSVSGNKVYVANDVVVSQSPYNTEIFFLRSLDNGATWSAPQQLSFAVGRSEDEAIEAQGSHIHMSWNDNRTNQFQIFYKESSDYGVTWGPDVVVDLPYDYNTMVSVDGAHVDVIACGAPSGHFQLLLAQSADTGATWGATMDLSNDTAHTYFLPHMVRDGSNLHVVCNSGGGSKYYHSADGGVTWDAPVILPGVSFIAYTGCDLHVIYVGNPTHNIYYLRNPTGNSGPHCPGNPLGISQTEKITALDLFPNPSDNSVTVQSPDELGPIVIYNSMGEMVYAQTSNATEQKIDISKFPKGIYFLSAQEKFLKLMKE